MSLMDYLKRTFGRRPTLAEQQAYASAHMPPLTGPANLVPQGRVIYTEDWPQQPELHERFVCQLCGADFVSRELLYQHYYPTHLMGGHTIDRMRCTACNRPGESSPYFSAYCEHCGGSGFEPVTGGVRDGRLVITVYEPDIRETDVLTCPRCYGTPGCEICHGSGRVTRRKLHELGFRGFIPPENFSF